MDSPDPDDAGLEEAEDITETLDALEANPPSTGSLKHTLLAIERREYIAALKRSNGQINEARRQLGVTVSTFHAKLIRFGLKPADWRRRPPS